MISESEEVVSSGLVMLSDRLECRQTRSTWSEKSEEILERNVTLKKPEATGTGKTGKS